VAWDVAAKGVQDAGNEVLRGHRGLRDAIAAGAVSNIEPENADAAYVLVNYPKLSDVTTRYIAKFSTPTLRIGQHDVC
jgi:hypothetical protein